MNTMRVEIMMATGLLLLANIGLADDQAKLTESKNKWLEAREQCRGNYSYKVRWSSFVGFGHVTEVVVRDNKVAERRYWEFKQPGPRDDKTKWVETGEALGNHKEGAALKTLDELYDQAAAVLKRNRPEHERLYLRFDKRGLLQSCFTVDTRIADDAPRKGVIISSLQLDGGEDQKPANEKVHKAPNGKPFPKHWGAPPRLQTRDLRPLPGGYGKGSGTLAKWIQMNLDRDATKK